MHQAAQDLDDELDRLRADTEGRVLTSALRVRSDARPIARQASPTERGVALYFNLRGKPKVFACDRWARIEHNVRAIAKTIEALRGVDRWGCGTVEKAFTGYQALPEVASGETCWDVLECKPFISREAIRARFRERVAEEGCALEHGDSDKMAHLVRALNEALKLAS